MLMGFFGLRGLPRGSICSTTLCLEQMFWASPAAICQEMKKPQDISTLCALILRVVSKGGSAGRG
jgi:hypothetical protein